MKIIRFIILIGMATSCQTEEKSPINVMTSDIDHFWTAYDLIIKESDSLKRIQLIDSLYIQQGSIGLKKIMEVREYSAEEYIQMITSYPNFLSSLRQNTLKSNELANELSTGIEKLKAVYPNLKPAKIYFTIGCMRSNGTTIDSLVLIGSELAMADQQTNISEFDGATKEWLETFFNSNPIDNLVLLNVHEYIHTQQKTQVNNLLSIAIREGVAEFVSTLAMEMPSATPSIAYGKNNAQGVLEKFELEMFYPNNQSKWFWSNYPNEFGVRDLGYYIGYQLCEYYYTQAEDKEKAIKRMIELDYTNEVEVEDFVEQTRYFSTSLDSLYQRFENKRPYVTGIRQFENNSMNVDAGIRQITIDFSEPLNGHNTGVDFGELGQDYFPKNDVTKRFWSEDKASWTISVELDPGKHYQLLISNNFRTSEDIPLKPYLIDFSTAN
ncbi:hypothetical protein [Marinoscillum sp. 108]|uniref:hypothetical protein n=1 Tax=Marinoscillum sp. 108 TaxID=2653151 RepID=UPI0012F28CA2|nr:hypothetical protein [Marinoscillum sp. 108]VXD10549.1 conserved hypothetical protein [Marinoscillum sp. 108]